MTRLIAPSALKRELPAPPFPAMARRIAARVLTRKDPRLAVLVGPCSIHDRAAALDYAQRLRDLSLEVQDTLYLVMRVFFEKSRTGMGWKGMLYDPHLDGSHDIGAGLRLSRKILLEIAHLGVPCASELLDPIASYYIDDLITWGVIGARTCASQLHRQMASRFDCPIGFKNNLSGDLDPAILGILTARQPHTHLGLDPDGSVSVEQTRGNSLTHLILRGAERFCNFDTVSVEGATRHLRKHHLEPHLLIDCAHGNCGKDPDRQHSVFAAVLEQVVSGNHTISGLMLESHLFAGKQPLRDDPALLSYGVSITDSCLSWEKTACLLRWADAALSCRPTSMSFVQN